MKALDQHHAALLVMMLREEGIDAACIRGVEITVSGRREDLLGDLFVPRADLLRAAELVVAHYDGSRNAEVGSRPWTCESCGETVDPVFQICWKCGSARGPSASAGR